MVIRNLLALLIFYSVGFCATIANVYGVTLNAADCSQASIQSAVNASSSGDTVVVPSGTCTWSSSVRITNAIALKGAGIGSTVINNAMNSLYGTGLIEYAPTAAEATKAFELSGFTLDGKYISGCFLASAPNATTAITGLKIHDNNFVNGNSRAIILSGLEFGVFYSNQFQDNYIAISVIGSEMNGWNYPLTQGGVNYPFFEDNTFKQSIARGGFIVETGRGGRIVFRNNTITGYGGAGGEVWDAHGVNGTYPTDTGTVSIEYYNNNVGLSASSRLLNHRGGKAIVFNNTVTGNRGDINMTEYQGWSYCTSQSYPKYQQVNNSLYWNNTTGGSSLNAALYCASGDCASSCTPAQYDSAYIQLNRDYWLPTSGLDVARPGTCADNAFYASTDTRIIYKCHPANTWTAYYRPYTFPHPLRSGALSAVLSAPQNLRVTNP